MFVQGINRGTFQDKSRGNTHRTESHAAVWLQHSHVSARCSSHQMFLWLLSCCVAAIVPHVTSQTAGLHITLDTHGDPGLPRGCLGSLALVALLLTLSQGHGCVVNPNIRLYLFVIKIKFAVGRFAKVGFLSFRNQINPQTKAA